MKITFIIKVKILVLNTWSYMNVMSTSLPSLIIWNWFKVREAEKANGIESTSWWFQTS